ncbi:MAG: phosphotransferase [Myxococcota bacterium]
MSSFPTRPEELNADRLTEYLRSAGVLGDAAVSEVSSKVIGTGKMGENVRLSLSYDGDPGEAPATLVAKLPATDERARAMAGGSGAYYHEVMFFRALADRTSMRTPRIYASELSEDRTSFLLLMEDLSPAEPGNQLVGASRAEAEVSLAEAAKLASAFYGDEGLAEVDYVVSAAKDDGGAMGQALMEQSWPDFADRYGHGLSAECLAFGEQYAPKHSRFVMRYDGAKTLIHGDFRSENILYAGGTAAIVDWQTTSESSPLADAAYFLGGSLESSDRRDWERALIEQYRQNLEAGGAVLSAQDCWDQYREFSMHGLMITVLGATFSTPDERSDRMFLAMIQRHLQHCIDLDAAEFLA